MGNDDDAENEEQKLKWREQPCEDVGRLRERTASMIDREQEKPEQDHGRDET